VHQDASTALVQWGPGIAYSRLLRFRTDEGAEIPNGEVECDLCDSWTLVGPLEYRIKLRDGVRWQDTAPVSGRPLVANDVVFSLRRQSSPGWPNAPLLATLKDIAAVDDLTVRLELTGPDIDFLARLADGHSRIVPPETVAVNGSLLAGPVIGTGPWELVDASTSGFRFVANRDYFESGLPYADALHIDILPAGDVRAAALRTRTIDFVSAGPVDLTRAVEAFPELRRSSAIQPGVGVEVAINTTSPPFNSTAARQAALLAIDPWLDAIEIWHGAASPTAGLPVPAPSWLVADEALREFLAHPDRALASAGDAGIRPGTPVTVTVGEFAAEYVEQAFRLAAGLASIGFAPALERVSTRRYGDEVWFGGRFQVSVGAPPPVADLSEYLFAVHHSRGAWNTTGYRSARLDVLIEAQSAETGILRRLGLVQEIQLEVMRGAHRFAPATFRSEWAWWPNVGGFVPNTYRGESHFLARTWLVRSDQ
jgi:peptide/nickel transport system substrate-binding protein